MSDRGDSVKVSITISVRWWVAPYVAALGFAAMLMGTEPDEAKLAELIRRRGLRVTHKVL